MSSIVAIALWIFARFASIVCHNVLAILANCMNQVCVCPQIRRTPNERRHWPIDSLVADRPQADRSPSLFIGKFPAIDARR